MIISWLAAYCLASTCLIFTVFLIVDFNSHSIVFGKYAWYHLNFLKFTKAHFWPSMWSILENVSCALEKNVYSTAFGWNAYKHQLSPFGLMCHWRPVFTYWFYIWMICSLMKLGCYCPPLLLCYCWFLFLWPLVSVLDIEVLLCWVHIYFNYYRLFLGWSLYHYAVFFFVSCYFKVYFIWYEYCHSSFILVCISWNTFFLSLHFVRRRS